MAIKKRRPSRPTESTETDKEQLYRKLLREHVWDPEIPADVERSLWALIKRHYPERIKDIDPSERPEKLAEEQIGPYGHVYRSGECDQWVNCCVRYSLATVGRSA